jgi:hypothetical protein
MGHYTGLLGEIFILKYFTNIFPFNLLSVNGYLETKIFDLGQGRLSELFSRKELFCVIWGVAFWCKIVSLGQENQSLYFYKIKLVWMTLDISASNNNGRLLWKLSLNNNYDINNMQCETQRIFKMRTSRLVPPTIKELLCFRLHKSQHSSPFSLVQHKNWEFLRPGKYVLFYIIFPCHHL